MPQQLLISLLLIFRPKLHKNRFTDLQSTFEFPAVDVLLNRSLFLGDFDACQSAEQEMLVVLVGGQELLKVRDVELALYTLLV